MEIDTVSYIAESGSLHVKCSGEFGVGTQAVSAAAMLKRAIAMWIADHLQNTVAEIEVDYTAVDYTCGDGPVSSMVPLLIQGITKVRFVANSLNCNAFKGLLEDSHIPCFELTQKDETADPPTFTVVALQPLVSSITPEADHPIPLDESKLNVASQKFARRLFIKLPNLRPCALMERNQTSANYSLLVKAESPTGDAARQLIIWMEQGREPTVGFGDWHAHARSGSYSSGKIIGLIKAILDDHLVIIVNIGGQYDGRSDVIDIRRPNALAEELTGSFSSGTLEIKSWGGAADRIVCLEDLDSNGRLRSS